MPVPKLTPELKQQILSLYCETDASTVELASQFAVSSSTVLRLLKESLSTEDYQKSVKQKQSKHKRSLNQDPTEQIQAEFLPDTVAQTEPYLPPDEQEKLPKSNLKKKAKDLPQTLKQIKKEVEKEAAIAKKSNQLESDQLDLMAAFVTTSSAAESNDQIFNAFPVVVDADQDLSEDISEQPSQVLPEGVRISVPQINTARVLPKKVIKSVELTRSSTSQSPSQTLNQLSRELTIDSSKQSASQEFDEEEEILDEVSDQFDDQDDEFEHLDDVLEDEEDGDDQTEEEDSPLIDSSVNSFGQDDGVSQTEVKIYDLEDADLPSTCYMVVDKSSEMITRPLRDFSEIGKIPIDEQSRATLLIFSNHRVAKRFSRQNQRIIKFSAELIYITQQKLAAKGITRLLFEGRVYAL